MPFAAHWKCPVCQTSIHQGPRAATEPAKGVVYRCHVCRLELVYDSLNRALAVRPLDDDTPDHAA